MRNFLIILLTASVIFSASNNSEKKILLRKINIHIKIDGEIESIWNTADSISGFFQMRPFYGKDSEKLTTVKVLTTESSLYCLFICYDDKEKIELNTGKLDESYGDAVSIMLDTFNDKKTAYKLAVSSTGVRSDARMLDDARNRDYSWDGIWSAETRMYDWGYTVEMEVPYKSIQYDETSISWGLDFDRWIAHLNEFSFWCHYEQNEGQRISKFGKLLFEDFHPSVKGLNLEVYPVAISKATLLQSNKYKIDPNAGIDIFYNPSRALTFQLTANPDFAQIEADPYSFNISRYESYFQERRPFFTEGHEIFMASGRERNSGFYRPLELFYSRRIGKILPDGNEVPLTVGTKAFGRIDDWEYGGFMAMTGETNYIDDGEIKTEPRAYFTSARVKKQFFSNSTLGILYVGKYSNGNTNGVLDIDGAFRGSDWQLSYQLARSIKNSEGDFAGSFGFTRFTNKWMTLARGRYIGEKFDINQVGFVPWSGTSEFVGVTGPIWFFDQGYINQILLYGGAALNYENIDNYLDRVAVLGFNMQFRNNWGYEINVAAGRAKDSDVKFNYTEYSFSTWMNISSKWHLNVWGGYSKTYNFSRDYLAFYSWIGSYFDWKIFNTLNLGTSINAWIEGNPDGNIEDITYNARPFISFTPINDLNVRIYIDNLYIRSSKQIERIISGLLFSYNFLPKSWIYLAVNEIQDRSDELDSKGNVIPNRLHTTDR
ncbi:MAG: carbohydrate binding family 9 domain-containing protein, partial [Ignavibacteria bacterium]|nr:carbohydrate binding family 9 domain-containing protein [Ignavibacteria bacterium]